LKHDEKSNQSLKLGLEFGIEAKEWFKFEIKDEREKGGGVRVQGSGERMG